MFGKLDGRVGIFPADYVEPMSRIEARKISSSSSRNNHHQVCARRFLTHRQTLNPNMAVLCFCCYLDDMSSNPKKKLKCQNIADALADAQPPWD